MDAAVATAARDVLVALLPDQTALVEAAYTRALAGIPDGARTARASPSVKRPPRPASSRRQGDGLEDATQPVYVPRPGPGEYQFTPPFNFAALPGWGRVTPFVIDLREHALEGPDRLSSVQYARDFAYVKAIGDIDSRIRTAEQSEIAQFWYEDSPARLEPHCEHGDPAAKTGQLVGGAGVRTGELRDGGRLHRRLRGQVPVPLLAAGNGDPRGGDRWQSLDRGGPDVAAVPHHAASAGLSVHAHGRSAGRLQRC